MTAPRFTRLQDWLRWQERLHPNTIELGLERVQAVAERLAVRRPAPVAVAVGGTNGKGSVVVMLEAVLRAQGYRTGAYLSPHLFRYNERIRIDGEQVPDDALCDAFAAVDAARGDTSLTYFEFGTLAALWLFQQAGVAVALLEVGLGGRLDAVNVVNAHAAVVTSVGLDHTDWLGDDRDSIGREKAGIWRAGRVAVCGERKPPQGLIEAGMRIGADLRLPGRDFQVQRAQGEWHWCGRSLAWPNLPMPALAGGAQIDNAAAALALLEGLAAELPVARDAVADGLARARLPGRLQVVPGRVPVLLDVAHNAEAAGALVRYLEQDPAAGRNIAVVGMLKDKPIRAVGRVLDQAVSAWYAGTLDGERGLTGQALAERLGRMRGPVSTFRDPAAAFRGAWRDARPGDRVVVLGSFRTVAAVSESARWMKS